VDEVRTKGVIRKGCRSCLKVGPLGLCFVISTWSVQESTAIRDRFLARLLVGANILHIDLDDRFTWTDQFDFVVFALHNPVDHLIRVQLLSMADRSAYHYDQCWRQPSFSEGVRCSSQGNFVRWA